MPHYDIGYFKNKVKRKKFGNIRKIKNRYIAWKLDKDYYDGEMITKKTDGTIIVELYDRGYLQGEIKTPESIKQNNEIELAAMINDAKNTCKTLGFKEGTEKFTDCSLKLYTQAVENKVALKVAKQKSLSSTNSGSMVIYDPVRDSQNQIDRGMKMLSGGCTLGIDC